MSEQSRGGREVEIARMVDEANTLTTAIIDGALANPDSGILIEASRTYLWEAHITDRDEIAALWQDAPERTFWVDVPIEGERLGIDRYPDYTIVWLYQPPRVEGAIEAATAVLEGETPPASTELEMTTNWLQEEYTRFSDRNLISPRCMFRLDKRPDGEDKARVLLAHNFSDNPTVTVMVHQRDDGSIAGTTEHPITKRFVDIDELTPEVYAAGAVPPLSDTDRRILEASGPQAVIDRRVQQLLAVMRAVAGGM